jgi:hypothetical protein
MAGTWTNLAHLSPDFGGTPMLLTDGTVMMEGSGETNTWYKLTPDSTGSYVNGTFSQLASMHQSRLYFASEILQNGNLWLQGGEYSTDGTYNGSSNPNVRLSPSSEIYNPLTNTWANEASYPQPYFGDDPSSLMSNGTILEGYIFGTQTYIYNPSTNSYNTATVANKLNGDRSDEETWIRLPDDSILSYNVFSNNGAAGSPAQRYIPSTNTWVSAGTVPVALTNSANYGSELGPGGVMPNGTVFLIGANGNTAIYDIAAGTWSQGPTVPGGYGADDAPGAVESNGDYLFTADKPLFNAPTHIFEYSPSAGTITDITSLAPASLQSQLGGSPSYVDRMLDLPNGQIMFVTNFNEQWLYTPGISVTQEGNPSITNVAYNGGGSYTMTGQSLSGFSEGAAYGDDAEMATNYPIVSLQVGSTLYYGRTTNWNKNGIGASQGTSATSTNFTLPAAVALPPNVAAPSFSAAESASLNNVVVTTFTDPNGGNHAGTAYTATINWGDGNVTAGTVNALGNNTYSVTSTRSSGYAEEGNETVTVTVQDNYASGNMFVSASGISSPSVSFNQVASNSASVPVSDPSVSGNAGSTFNTTAGVSTGTVTLATFTDPAGAELQGDYGASVDWGNGTTPGTITGPVNGVFTVTGSRTYSTPGAYNVAITLSHDASVATVVNDTVDVASAVTNVTSLTPDGTYGRNEVIQIQIAFNANETVTGVPSLALNSGGTASAVYTSGSGTSDLVFDYTIAVGDASPHLDYTGTNAISLNGGTINGPGGVPAILTLASPGNAGSLGANSNLVIDTTAPTVVSYNVLFGSESYNLIGSIRFDLPWTITGIQAVFSKPIGSADMNSLTGVTTTGISGVGTNTVTWTISPISIGTFSTALAGSGGDAITDAAGNPLTDGAGFTQNFKVLLGDFFGDGVVNAADMTSLINSIGGPYNIFADINGDGSVNIADAQIVRKHIGTHL